VEKMLNKYRKKPLIDICQLDPVPQAQYFRPITFICITTTRLYDPMPPLKAPFHFAIKIWRIPLR